MIRFNQVAACIAGILAIGVSHAAADVIEFQFAKLIGYDQVSTSPPVSPSGFAVDTWIDMDQGDATLVTVNGVGVPQIDPEQWSLYQEFPSQGALDAAFPGSSFNMHLQGGTLGVLDETIVLPSPAVYPAPATLTPASFNAAQSASPNQTLVLEWSPADANTNAIFLTVSTVTGAHIKVIDVVLPPEQTSFAVPAGALNPEQPYEIILAFANASFFQGEPGPGFGVASNGIAAYASLTFINFTTNPTGPSGVVDFWVTKVRDYHQTSQSPPTTPFNYDFDSVVNTAAGDATSATINGHIMVESYPGEWDGSVEFASQAALDAAYPSNVPYTYALSGGTLGSVSETFPAFLEHYPAPPALTPANYNDVQNIDTTQDFLVDWNAPDPSTDFVVFAIYDINTDTCVLDMFFITPEGSFLIPAGTMDPDTDYELEIGFAHGVTVTGSPTPGFGTQAQGLAGYESVTLVEITTAPAICEDVGTAGVIKEKTYIQATDNTPPASPILFRFDAFIYSFDAAIGSANVSNGITTVPFLQEEPGAWELDQTNVEFGSKAALDANFPSSMPYTLHIQDGTLGTRDQTVTLSADDYPDTPFLTGTSFSDLDAMDPAQELTINWSLPSLNTTHIFFEIYNTGTDTKDFDAQLSPGTTSITIPADVLVSGEMYEMDINLVASPISFADDCPGFGLGSVNITGFVSSTSVFFTPVSCPADLTGDGTLDFFDISAFLTAFSSSDPVADFTGDGTFDFFDISAFLTEFGNGCP